MRKKSTSITFVRFGYALQRPSLFWVACFGNVLTALSSSDMESLWDLSHIDKRSAPPMPYKLELKAWVYHYYTWGQSLELKLIRHGWGASLVDVGQVSKTFHVTWRQSREDVAKACHPKKGRTLQSMPKADKHDWGGFFPHNYYYYYFWEK